MRNRLLFHFGSYQMPRMRVGDWLGNNDEKAEQLISCSAFSCSVCHSTAVVAVVSDD
jgi:hypothetical protein